MNPSPTSPAQPLCPSFEMLFDFNVGRVTDDQLDSIASHLETCQECHKTIETICHEGDDLITQMRDDEVQQPSDRGGPPAELISQVLHAIERVPDESHPSDGPDSSLDVQALGEYELLDKLGQGGMGAVYRGRHSRLGKLVAVKLLAPGRVRSSQALKRFRREIRAIGGLDHPNIVRALDAGEVQGTHFLVMEYAEGDNLSALVRRRGALPVSEAVEYIRQAAVGLQHIHDCGLIHRDIKPSNLILTQTGSEAAAHSTDAAAKPTVKILDLGLALLTETAKENSASDDHDLTRADQVVGTFDYIAPEQAKRAHLVDSRADIYGLGCSLYFLLAGRAPYWDHSVVEKLTAHQLETPEPLSSLRNDIPPGVMAILDRMVAKSPSQRFQTPQEVAEAIERWQHDPDRPLPASRRAGGALTGRGLAVGGGALVLTLLAVFAYLFAGTIFRLAANKGEVVIESDAKEVEVVVKGNQGRIVDRKTGRTILLKPGDYTIEVTMTDANGETRFLTRKLSLKRGGRQIVRAEFVPKGSPRSPPSPPAPTGIAKNRGPYRFPPIPERERFPWQPKELVSVLGEHRARHWSPIDCGDLSRDGKLLATGGQDHTIRIWDAQTLELKKVLAAHIHGVTAVAFSPDSKQLVSGGIARNLFLWDLTAAQPRPRLISKRLGQIASLQFSADGKQLLVAATRLTLWSTTGPRFQRLAEVDEGVAQAVFSPDGLKVFAGGRKKEVVAWDVTPAGLVEAARMQGHTEKVTSVAVSSDGKCLASGGFDDCVRVWNVDDLKSAPRAYQLPRGCEVLSVAFSSDNQHLAAGVWAQPDVLFWNLNTTKPKLNARNLCGGTGDFICFRKGDDQLIAAGTSGVLRVAKTTPTAASPAAASSGHEGPVVGMGELPDSRVLVSVGADARVSLWDMKRKPTVGKTGEAKPLRSYPSGLPVLRAAALTTDGRWLCVGGGGLGVPLVEGNPRADNWPARRVATRHRSTIQSLAFSADGRWLASASRPSGDQLSHVQLWRVDKNGLHFERVLFELPREKGTVRSVAFSPRRPLLAVSGQDGLLRLWNLESKETEPLALPHDTELGRLAFSPDGQRLAVGGRDYRVFLWSMAENPPRKLATFKAPASRYMLDFGNQSNPVGLAFAPDGKTIAVATVGQLSLWHPDRATKPRSLTFPGEIWSLLFLADGKHLAVGNANGTIYILRTDTAAD